MSGYLRLSRYIIMFIILMLSAFSLWAGGKQDLKRDYEYALIERFEPMIEDLDSSRITAEEAKSELEEIRTQFRQEYSDLSGILDAMIDGIAEKKITAGEVLESFNNMLNERIREYNAARNADREQKDSDSKQQDKKENKPEGK